MSSALHLTQRLKDRRAELIQRRQRVERAVSHREEPVVADFDDGAIQRENDEVLGTLAEAIDAELAAIDKALEHAAKGLQGICEKCEQPISSARLAAVPYAVTCSTCESE
jgi:RNA polymerase-binding transcription factor DksA